ADPEGPCFYCRRDNYGILDTRPNPDEIIDLLDRRIQLLKQTFGKEDRETTIAVVCPAPNCGKTLTVPARHQGKQGKCPSCGTAMTISSHDHQT
ncbi:MAG: hypothetical protein MK103_02180, partial [Planctomycetes bacterium]|nr:hypothetical protein [Planctomycetota bacterium]